MQVSRRRALGAMGGITGAFALAGALSGVEAKTAPVAIRRGVAQAATDGITLQASNMKLLGASDLNGFGRMGEGIAIQQRSNGQRVAYLANESGPMGMSVVDVTDPTSPGVIAQIPAENGGNGVRFNSLSMSGDILVVAREQTNKGGTPAGLAIYDASDPANLKQLSFFDTSGPTSRGCHFVWFVDGRYAHMTTGMPDFQPNNAADDEIYVIADLQDPQNPKEVGRWWLPGQKAGEPPLKRLPPGHDNGFRPHNINVLPSRPDRAYVGYIDGGAAILDISDMQHPKMVSRWDPHPPETGFSHTFLPHLSRGLAMVSHESVTEDCSDYPKMIWTLDISVETNPVSISTAPLPDASDFCGRGGRFGAHNMHENHEQATSMDLQNTVVGSFFNGGVRMYDTSNPFQVREIGYWIGDKPPTSTTNAIQINDVFVDETGLIYAVERIAGGLYILQYTGETPMS